MTIDPANAFTHLSRLTQAYQNTCRDTRSFSVDVRSLTAPPEKAFGPKRNRFIRFFDKIRFRFTTKIKTKEYELNIQTPAYDNLSNRNALRSLFKAAMGEKAKNIRKLSSNESFSLNQIITFAFSIDDNTDEGSCFAVLKNQLLTQIDTVDSIQSLADICLCPIILQVLEKEAADGQNALASKVFSKLSNLAKTSIPDKMLPSFGMIIGKVFQTRWKGLAATISFKTAPQEACLDEFLAAKKKDEKWFDTFRFPTSTDFSNLIYVQKEAAGFVISTLLNLNTELDDLNKPLTDLLHRQNDLSQSNFKPIMQEVYECLIDLSELVPNEKQKNQLIGYANRIKSVLQPAQRIEPSQPSTQTTAEKTTSVFHRTIGKLIPSFWQLSSYMAAGAATCVAAQLASTGFASASAGLAAGGIMSAAGGVVTAAIAFPPTIPMCLLIGAAAGAAGIILDPVAQGVGYAAKETAKKCGASDDTANVVGEIGTMAARVGIQVSLISSISSRISSVFSWLRGPSAVQQPSMNIDTTTTTNTVALHALQSRA